MQPLTISLVQTETRWHAPAENRSLFEGWFAEVADDAKLVVLPEMFSTGFTMSSREVAEPMSGPTVRWLESQASALGKVLCGSLVVEEGGRYFNRFVWVPPDAEPVCYDKRHRFRMAGEHNHYSAGTGRVTVSLAGWKLCPMICYDLRFPVWFRNRSDYDVLLCVANWPAARQLAWQTLLRARAIENQAYSVGVNVLGVDGNGVRYDGGSAVYAADGSTVLEAGQRAGVFTVTLDGASLEELRASFPVWQDADRFTLSD